MITIVTLMCHIINLGIPLCHEEVVAKIEMSMMACQIGHQQIVSDWKEKTKFKGDQWTVAMIHCYPGENYQPRDAI